MPIFEKKPVRIEARLFLGTPESRRHIAEWAADYGKYVGGQLFREDKWCLIVPTLEGNHVANPGDWIIKGVADEFYPCKPDIFDKTYTLVREEP